MPLSSLHFILGGTRSGKSRRAEQLATTLASAKKTPVTYLATYAFENSDLEMSERVAHHRQQRPASWITVENRFDLKNLFSEHAQAVILLDCLTLWLSYRQTIGCAEIPILAELEGALLSLSPHQPGVIIVSTEVGLGLVPASPEGRAFRDLAGRAHQLVAQHAARVEFIIAGLPQVLKGEKS